MLHKVNPAAEAELRKVMALQRQVLAYACRADLIVPIDRTQQDTHFGPLAGWFRQHTTLHTALKQLNAMVRGDPALAAQVLAAYDNDTAFDSHADDPAFTFQCCALPTPVRSPLKYLLGAFYSILAGDGGYSDAVTGAASFNRRDFVARFMSANDRLKVCPACDGQRSDRTGEEVHATCDHYFPKSHHPALSVHPSNLLPTCTDCNLTFKGERDACDHAAVHEGFLPYGREAFGPLEVRVFRNPAGVLALDLLDGANPSTPRLDALDHVLQLRQRWTSRLADYVAASVVNRLRDMRASRANENATVTADDIVGIRNRESGRRSLEPNRILSEAYLGWLSLDASERNATLAMNHGN